MKKLKLGMVGAASRGGSFFQTATMIPGVEFTAACDRCEPQLLRTLAGHAAAEVKPFTSYDRMLKEANVVITPGAGFGRMGEGFFRISAFNSRENVEEAVKRIKSMSLQTV